MDFLNLLNSNLFDRDLKDEYPGLNANHYGILRAHGNPIQMYCLQLRNGVPGANLDPEIPVPFRIQMLIIDFKKKLGTPLQRVLYSDNVDAFSPEMCNEILKSEDKLNMLKTYFPIKIITKYFKNEIERLYI